MTRRLSEEIDDAIKAPGAVEVEHGGVKAHVDVIDAGPIGVAVDRLRIDGPDGDVAQRTHDLARQLRPTGERLVPVEVAPDLGGGVLRTQPGDMRGGRFYEVEVDRGSVEITRHRVDGEGQRTREPFRVTREQLGDIADSVEGVLKGEEAA